MAVNRNLLARILLAGGVLLLAKGGSSLYPVLFPGPMQDVVLGESVSARFEPGTFLFQMSLPRLHGVYAVVEGTGEASLRKGPGHLEGSPLPGMSGNSVIAGHRDTYFRVLKEVAVGDVIQIRRDRHEYAYRVVETRVVAPDDLRPLMSQPSDSSLTLITCYPFYFIGPAPKRFIVRATAL